MRENHPSAANNKKKAGKTAGKARRGSEVAATSEANPRAKRRGNRILRDNSHRSKDNGDGNEENDLDDNGSDASDGSGATFSYGIIVPHND